jgi:hypothetical protein
MASNAQEPHHVAPTSPIAVVHYRLLSRAIAGTPGKVCDVMQAVVDLLLYARLPRECQLFKCRLACAWRSAVQLRWQQHQGTGGMSWP